MRTGCKYFFWVIFVSSFLAKEVRAQQQWKFHIAFEDGIGARDTIWLIWDTTATGGVDTALGEGPVQMNYSIFNVFIGNANADTTKTSALPYNYYPANSAIVYAMNYQYPLTIRWDSSLFHAPFLPPLGQDTGQVAVIDNDYFFSINNSPVNHNFDMLLDNNVSAPAFNWGSQSQFPMYFTLSYDVTTGIPPVVLLDNLVKIFPNPSYDYVRISSDEKIEAIEIFSPNGKSLYRKNFDGSIIPTDCTIPISELSSGLYFIKINFLKKEIIRKIMLTK